MINFQRLEKEKDELREKFLSAKPFPHIAIDDFLDKEAALKLYENAPKPSSDHMYKDYFFSKNRYAFENVAELSPYHKELMDDILSDKFAKLISYITDEDVFFDPDMHGGGAHVGALNSHLDMHADYNYHPKKPTWYRNLNLLLYLNKDWKEEYGGSLKLEDHRTGERTEVQPLFNRLAIMHCREYTLHGYDTTHFPEGKYRTSIAIYAYTLHKQQQQKPRTTIWVSEDSKFKQALAKVWIPAVAIKKRLIG